MKYLEFKNKFYDLSCVGINQIHAWQPDFDRNNLTRWLQKGLLIHLRQGYYTFPKYKQKSDYQYYFANQIYKPSYLSLQSALAYYDIIPESVLRITSVTTLKTNNFSNELADYSFRSIKEDFFFGFDLKSFADGKTLLMATPEKAILDFFYFYPMYKSRQDFFDLRFDEEFLKTDLNKDLLWEMTARFGKKSLQERIQLFMKAYQL